MRPHGTQEQLEQRRRRAVGLHQQGHSRKAIAAQVGATPQAVGRWVQAFEQGGPLALAAKPVQGPPPKLSPRQRQGLVRRLLKGAQANGFATDLWTCPRVAEVIRRQYGVTYHVDHLSRVLASLGFSPSEARPASHGTRRGGHRPLDRRRVAADPTAGGRPAGPPGLHR